jgi:ankyrin repeat protein
MGHFDVVKILLNNKASVNHSDRAGATALIEAASEGHFEIVKILVKLCKVPR